MRDASFEPRVYTWHCDCENISKDSLSNNISSVKSRFDFDKPYNFDWIAKPASVIDTTNKCFTFWVIVQMCIHVLLILLVIVVFIDEIDSFLAICTLSVPASNRCHSVFSFHLPISPHQHIFSTKSIFTISTLKTSENRHTTTKTK